MASVLAITCNGGRARSRQRDLLQTPRCQLGYNYQLRSRESALPIVMQYNLNVVGQNIVKFRHQRGWTQDELAAKLQLLGCNITRQILANIEIRRCPATDIEIIYFAEVFGVEADAVHAKSSR
jgi:ribosome-binding protein aMBF1 (putative translation factor)